MGEMVFYEEKKVEAKGLKLQNQIDEQKLKQYFFKDDYQNLKLLNSIKIPFEKKTLTLLYPGCGADILFPLIYLKKLFPKTKTAQFVFVDLEDNLGLIKTILDEIGFSFEEEDNQIRFYWKKVLIELQFFTQSITDYLTTSNQINVYFERAFRIMREQIPGYEEKIFQKILPGGILISDSGFKQADLKRIKVPSGLSSYREMVIGVKK